MLWGWKQGVSPQGSRGGVRVGEPPDGRQKFLSLIQKHRLTRFYRATLFVSAVFAIARCPSVRPSVTLVHCIQIAEDIVKLLTLPGSPIILDFFTLSADTQFQGELWGAITPLSWDGTRG